MPYRKSWKGFLLWLLFFIVSETMPIFLPVADERLITRIVLVVTAFDVALLALIIFLTESIYWYNGVEFEAAAAAGSERRRAYALQHLLRFGIFAMLQTLVSVAAHLLGVGIWLDILFLCIGLTAVAVSTIRIQL